MRKKIEYEYFVSYTGRKGGNLTLSHCGVFADKEIKTMADIKKMADKICCTHQLDDTPTILNYRLLGKVCVVK